MNRLYRPSRLRTGVRTLVGVAIGVFVAQLPDAPWWAIAAGIGWIALCAFAAVTDLVLEVRVRPESIRVRTIRGSRTFSNGEWVAERQTFKGVLGSSSVVLALEDSRGPVMLPLASFSPRDRAALTEDLIT